MSSFHLSLQHLTDEIIFKNFTIIVTLKIIKKNSQKKIPLFKIIEYFSQQIYSKPVYLNAWHQQLQQMVAATSRCCILFL